MIKVVYYSRHGKVKKFVEKVIEECSGIIAESIDEYSGGDYVFITPTYGYGEVPKESLAFLEENSKNLKAVASSGNMVWGLKLFANSGTIISMLYKVPLVAKFENQGMKKDVIKFIEGLKLVGLD